MIRKVVYTAPYKQDNSLNVWSDFDRLRVTLTRDDEKSPDNVTVEVQLEGDIGRTTLDLSNSTTALLNFFLQNATKEP